MLSDQFYLAVFIYSVVWVLHILLNSGFFSVPTQHQIIEQKRLYNMTKKITAIYFSPTHTTEKIVKTIAAEFTGTKVNCINVTRPKQRIAVPSMSDTDLLIIGSPVYSGAPPKLFMDYLRRLKGQKTEAAIISVYGNRSAGSTCSRMSHLLTENGFSLIAAAEFIGEHAFSNSNYPIAAGRPDSNDLLTAIRFGRLLKRTTGSDRISPAASNTKLMEPEQPIYFPPPQVSESCTNCGLCRSVCPVDRIEAKATGCLGCGACVRTCPHGARQFPEKIQKLQTALSLNCQNRLEPRTWIY